MSGISPFLDICQSETFAAKAIMGKTDTSHSTISTAFFFREKLCVEGNCRKIGGHFCSPVQWFLTTITRGSSDELLKDVWQNTTTIKFTVFWDETPLSLINEHQRSGDLHDA